MSTKLTLPTVPFSEAPWISGLPSPYFQEKHKKLREFCKKWCEDYLIPNAQRLENEGKADPKLYAQAAKDGLLIPFAVIMRRAHKQHRIRPLTLLYNPF
jgi:hypothetical protein